MKSDVIKCSTELSRVAIVFNCNEIEFQELLKEVYQFYGGPKFFLFPCEQDHIKDSFLEILLNFDPDIIVELGELDSTLQSKIQKSNPIKIIKNNKFKESFVKRSEIKDQNEETPDIFYSNLKEVDKRLFPYEVYNNVIKESSYIGNITNYYNYIDNVFCTGLSHNSGFYSHDNVNNDNSINKILVKDSENPLCSQWGLRDFYCQGYQIVVLSDDNVYDLCLYWNLRNYYWNKGRREKVIAIEYKEIDKIIDYIDSPSFFINIFSNSMRNNDLEKQKELIYARLIEKHEENKTFLKININPIPPVVFHTISFVLESSNSLIYWYETKNQYLLKWSKLDISPLYYTKISCISIDGMVPMPRRIQEYKNLILNPSQESKVSIEGIRVLTSNSPYLYMRDLESINFINEVIKNRGYNIFVSDKGEIGFNLLKHIGKIEDLAFLQNKDILDLIKNSKNRIFDNKSIEKFEDIIPLLIKKKVLLQGFDIKCKFCKQSNWSSSIDFQSQYKCQHCYSDQELDIKYENKFKVNQLYSLAYNQGVITHLLTIYELYTQKRIHGKRLFHFIPGAVINELNREIDFIIIDEEGLKIGECKNDAKEIDNQEVDSIIHVSDLLKIDKLFFCSLKNGFSRQLKDKLNVQNIEIIENLSVSKRIKKEAR